MRRFAIVARRFSGIASTLYDMVKVKSGDRPMVLQIWTASSRTRGP